MNINALAGIGKGNGSQSHVSVTPTQKAYVNRKTQKQSRMTTPQIAAAHTTQRFRAANQRPSNTGAVIMATAKMESTMSEVQSTIMEALGERERKAFFAKLGKAGGGSLLKGAAVKLQARLMAGKQRASAGKDHSFGQGPKGGATHGMKPQAIVGKPAAKLIVGVPATNSGARKGEKASTPRSGPSLGTNTMKGIAHNSARKPGEKESTARGAAPDKIKAKVQTALGKASSSALAGSAGRGGHDVRSGYKAGRPSTSAGAKVAQNAQPTKGPLPSTARKG